MNKLRIQQTTADDPKGTSQQSATADQPQEPGQEEDETMGKTYTKPGKTGQIIYVVNFYNGQPVSALSFFTREDGLGGTQEVIRRLDPNGPTIRKLVEEQK